MKRISLAALICLAATLATSAQNARTTAVPGIDTSGMDRSVRPQDDFFRFVNGAWVDRTPIPPDRSNYGTFAMLGERSLEAVRGILEAEAIKPAAPGSMDQKIGGFYKSFTDEAGIEARGIQPLAGELAAIDAIAAGKDFPAAFARAARTGVRLPISVTVGQDPQRSDVYAVLISQSGLGMPDRDYYLRRDEKFVGIRKAYTDYIAKLFTLANQKDPAGAAARPKRHVQQDGAHRATGGHAEFRLARVLFGQPRRDSRRRRQRRHRPAAGFSPRDRRSHGGDSDLHVEGIPHLRSD